MVDPHTESGTFPEVAVAPARQALSFKPRARLIRTIGDRLISGPEAALIELVKNAHDADAEWVRITFTPPLTPGKGTVVVADNGHGMLLSDISTKWMEPATTDKIARLRSPKRRQLLGSKGIGRFATARLGRCLKLQTTAMDSNGQRETTTLSEIDWDRFDEAVYLADVEFAYEITTGAAAAADVGTMLTITELRDQWTEAGFRKLHAELRRLISPLAGIDDDFKIYLDLSACDHVSCGFDGAAIVNGIAAAGLTSADFHVVRPLPLLRACDYEIDGAFDEQGAFTGTMTVHRGGQEPREARIDVPLDPSTDEASCGQVLIQLFVFDRETSAIRQTIQRADLGDISVTQARDLLDRTSGVAIYRNRFRIRPYGDSDQDWLTLDSRRVQDPSFRIGHNQVSGVIVIDDEKRSGLIERSSREGLEVNWSFRRLQHLLLALFSEVIEPRRRDFREGAGLERSRASSFRNAYEATRLKWTERYLSQLDPQARQEFQTDVARESANLEKCIGALEQRQTILESRTTLGHIVAEVIHEGRPPVAYIQDETARLHRWWQTLFANTSEARRRRDEDVPSIIRGLGSSAEKLRLLFNALAPLSAEGRGRPRTYSPAQVVIDTFFLFRSRMETSTNIGHSITADPEIPDVEGYPNDLATAISNLLDNSIYWLRAKQARKPRVDVHLSRKGDDIKVTFSDNGPGIPEEFADRIFEVGFTLRPNGFGLGLSIAQEALHRAGGEIRLGGSAGPGASFLITLPLRSPRRDVTP